MTVVTLASGGLDSTVMAVLSRRQGRHQFPLFIDYGQLCCEREWAACRRVHLQFGLPEPTRMDLAGFGRLVSSGLTDARKRVNEDAFLPGRNLLFLLAGAAFACEKNAVAVCIGLLTEEDHLFPDQTSEFLKSAESIIRTVTMREIAIAAPLLQFNKAQMIALGNELGVSGTYSCHAGTLTPCGKCVSCLETAGLSN